MNKLLTKSKYLYGLQCAKLLWISVNDKDRIPPPNKALEKKFEDGNIIGELATYVFPKGENINVEDFKENLDKSKELLKKRIPLFEASFLFNNLYSRADILNPVGDDEWDIIEVKSSTKVKDLNVHDVSFQKYVYEKCGIKIRNCILMHLDKTYLKKGEINPKKLFVQTKITQEVSIAMNNINERIEDMIKVINSKKCPEFDIDDLGTIIYDNIAKDEFIDSLPKENVFQLYRGGVKSRDLYKEGIVKIKDIPDDQKLTKNQQIQRDCAINQKPHINKDKIKKFLDDLQYPLYYLDFEAMTPALPKYDHMKPYQHIPFQYSLHVVEKPGAKPKHISFLADGNNNNNNNPIPEFMQSLKDNLGDKGDIIVYSQVYEISKLKEAAALLPEFEDLVYNNFLKRIKDLLIPFRNFDYYDSRQKGKAGLKNVLPVMSNLSYKELSINNGTDASLEFERITFDLDVKEEERLKVREALEKYCELDTRAEVEIIERLKELI